MSDGRTGERGGERVRLEDPVAVGADHLIEEFEAEKPARELTGFPKLLLSVAGVGLSCYALYWVLNPVPAQIYRTSFLAVALAMTFILYRAWGSSRETGREGEAERAERPSDNPGVTDYLFAVLSVVALGYTLVVFDEFVRRAARPETLDLVFGLVTILLVLEATRRTVGWILPVICAFFIAYAYLGALIPVWARIGHVGYGPNRIVGQTYMGLEGLFGVPLDVAATYIVLFTIYGAVLEFSGLAGSSSTSASPPSGPGRRPPPAAPPPWPGSCSAPSPGRGWRPRSPWGRWPGRCCAGPATRPTRAAGSCRRPGSGPSCPRRPWARPPSSSPSSWRSPTCRCCCSPPPRRCSTTWASSWPSRWTAAATAPAGSTSTPGRWAGCCCATVTTSAR